MDPQQQHVHDKNQTAPEGQPKPETPSNNGDTSWLVVVFGSTAIILLLTYLVVAIKNRNREEADDQAPPPVDQQELKKQYNNFMRLKSIEIMRAKNQEKLKAESSVRSKDTKNSKNSKKSKSSKKSGFSKKSGKAKPSTDGGSSSNPIGKSSFSKSTEKLFAQPQDDLEDEASIQSLPMPLEVISSAPHPNMEAIDEAEAESNSTHRQSDNQRQGKINRRKDANFRFFTDARREVVQISKSDPPPQVEKLEKAPKQLQLAEIKISIADEEQKSE